MSAVHVTGSRERRKVSPAVQGEGNHEGAQNWIYPHTSAERAELTKTQPEGDDVDGLAYLRHADDQSDLADAAWREHVAGLTEEKRLDYERRGLIEKPRKKSARKKWVRVEAAEERSVLREAVSEDAGPLARLMAKEETQVQGPLVAARFILAEIIDAERPRLSASIIALALGIGAGQRIDVSTIVWHFRVPKVRVLREVARWQAQLGTNALELTLPRYIVGQILDDPRPRLQADTFALAFGFPLRQGMSERKLAIEYGLTVATLSARVRWWIDHLQARLPGVCKRNTANYQDFNVRRQPADPFRSRQ